MAPCSVARRARQRVGDLAVHVARPPCATPLPPHASPPSRSSAASNSPVEAPEGTAARPSAPDVERHVDLDRRVAARVEDLPAVDALDRRHRSRKFASSRREPVAEAAAPAARRASSGSTPQARGPASTSANSGSPIARVGGVAGLRVTRALVGRLERPRSPRRRPRAAASCARRAAPAGSRARRANGSSAARPSSLALDPVPVREHLAGPRVVGARPSSPNTCGWRRISFCDVPSATSARLPAPRSSSSSARK